MRFGTRVQKHRHAHTHPRYELHERQAATSPIFDRRFRRRGRSHFTKGDGEARKCDRSSRHLIGHTYTYTHTDTHTHTRATHTLRTRARTLSFSRCVTLAVRAIALFRRSFDQSHVTFSRYPPIVQLTAIPVTSRRFRRVREVTMDLSAWRDDDRETNRTSESTKTQQGAQFSTV